MPEYGLRTWDFLVGDKTEPDRESAGAVGKQSVKYASRFLCREQHPSMRDPSAFPPAPGATLEAYEGGFVCSIYVHLRFD